jgi:hypothetical protein
VKAVDTTLFALTLLLVPVLGWWLGRVMGRRDWRIGPVISVSALIALIPNVARLLALAFIEGRPMNDIGVALMQRAVSSTEIGFFFLALSVFMTMLGWTSTPVGARPD